MSTEHRLHFLDNLRTFLIFLVVLVHAGVVYESSGYLAPYWLVDDPSTSDLPGLVNLILDIFVMPTIFFISGFFAPSSLERKGAWPFLTSKLRRLIVPWTVAVFTLIPIYNAIFLYSRGLPQGDWRAYFHFSNSQISMNWLWFLPALFLFDCLYVLLYRFRFATTRFTLKWAVVAALLLSFCYSVTVSFLGWTGWTKTPLIDFQNEKVVPYFLVFLLGSLCSKLGVLDTNTRKTKLYIAVNATVWIPMSVYVIVLLNFFMRPGQYIVSERIDVLLLWGGFYISMLALLYCAVTTFKFFFNRQKLFCRELGELSYSVYVIHVAVMGPIALALLRTDLPALLKYPILATTTWMASNIIAYAYAVVVKKQPTRPAT